MFAFYLFVYFSLSQYLSDSNSGSAKSLSNKILLTPATIRARRFSDIYSPFDVSFGTDGLSSTQITEIPDNLFCRCQIGTLTISKYITTIGIQSFYGCSINEIIFEPESQLETISSYAFYSVTFSKSFKFPDQIKTIGESSFENSGIQHINFNNITYIGKSCFRECSKLSCSLIFNYKQLTIGRSAFEGCIGLMNTVITFTNNALEGANKKEMRNCFGSLTIEEDAFKGIVFSALNCNGMHRKECSEYISRFVNTSSSTNLITRKLQRSSEKIGPDVYYNETFNEVIIYGNGEMYNYSKDDRPLRYSYIRSAIIKDNVTSIGSYMFYDLTELRCIILPNSLTSIGEYALSQCKSLANITIPNNLISIGTDAFSRCNSLPNITLPNSLTSIGDFGFSGCIGMKNITLSNSLTSIGVSVLSGCKYLTDIILPNNLISIGKTAFYGCSKLDNIIFPNSLISIGNSAFYDCSSLENITLSNNLASIGSSAFSFCKSLTKITLSNSLTSLEAEVFYDCSSLVNIVLSNNLASIGSFAFSRCNSLQNITLPNSLTTIDDNTFLLCTNLTSITFQDGLTSIGDSAFYICTSLESITLPNSLTSIGKSAFCDCTSLASITLPKSLTSIGNYAFKSCTSLSSVSYFGSFMPNCTNTIFNNCIKLSSINVLTNYENESFCGIDDLIVNDMSCRVYGCIKCVDDTVDQCEECNSSFIKVDGRCIDIHPTQSPSLDPTSSPVPKPDASPDYSKVDVDGNLYINFDEIGSPYEVKLILDYNENKQNGYIVKNIVINNTKNKWIIVIINEGYTELSFHVDEATKNKEFDIYPITASEITIGLEPSTFASIYFGQSRISLKSTAGSDTIKLNKIQPYMFPMTIVALCRLNIENLEFTQTKSEIYFDAKEGAKVSISNVNIAKGCFGPVGNVTITGVVTVGVSSTLKISKNVDLQSATIKYNYSNPQLAGNAGIISGTIASVPSKVVVSINSVGESKEEAKTLLAESADEFDCDSWGGRIEYYGEFNNYSCETGESSGYALYATKKKSKKLPLGVIVGITITAVVVVGVVVFVLVYFLVIKKKKEIRSTTSASLISEKKEALLY